MKLYVYRLRNLVNSTTLRLLTLQVRLPMVMIEHQAMMEQESQESLRLTNFVKWNKVKNHLSPIIVKGRFELI